MQRGKRGRLYNGWREKKKVDRSVGSVYFDQGYLIEYRGRREVGVRRSGLK